MATLADYFESFKLKKKFEASDLLGWAFYNYPHPLAGISVDGSLSYVVDAREFTEPGFIASRRELSLNLSPLAPKTRIFTDLEPFSGGLPDEINQFHWFHLPNLPWRVALNYASGFPEAVVVGSFTVETFERDSLEDPWEIVAEETVTEDVLARWYFGFFGGGEPVSGGKGDGSDDEKITITIYIDSYHESMSYALPFFNVAIKRFPWDRAWADESSAFSDMFNDYISEENSVTGGGHSGSCSIKASFLT